MRRRVPLRRQWTWPVLLSLATIIGLLSALLGQGGIWWWLSWIALALPLLAIVRHVVRKPAAPHRSR